MAKQPSPEPGDELTALARRASAGDGTALEELCRTVQDPIYRLALRMLSDPHDAEDCTQEIMIQVVTGQVTKPLATAARIPHTCVCTVTAIGDGAYNFINIPSPEAEAILWVREAQRRGISKIALITQDYPSIHNHVSALKTEAARVSLPITYEHEFADSVTDFRSIIAQARASNPDVYYVEALNPQLDVLGQQLSDAKIRNIASVVSPSLSEQPEVFEGAWYTDSNLRDIGFRHRFEARYPGTRFATHMMPYAYDDFNMIVQAFERGENPAVYIRNIARYDGTAGTLTKAPGSGKFQSTPAVWVIQNGKPALTSNHQTWESQ